MAASAVPASAQPSSLGPATPETSLQKPGGLTLRAIVLSLGLAFCFGYIIPIVDMKMQNTFLGATHLPPGAIAVLVILLLVVNPLLTLISRQSSRVGLVFGALLACGALSGLFWVRGGADSLLFWVFGAGAVLLLLTLGLGRRALSRNEVLTVYISCLFSTLAPGHGAENVFVVNLIGPFYYATRENKYLEWMVPYLQPWMTPALEAGPNGKAIYTEAGKGVVDAWFTNSPTGAVPWGAWLVPLVVWGGAVAVMYWMMACLSTIIRKQWAQSEALAFPLLRLPLELTEDVDKVSGPLLGGFFRNGAMWIGFGIAVFIQLLRGLNGYFPDFPDFPTHLDTGPLFTEAPWNQIGGVPIIVWPVIVGISYLLTAEISFSFWFFFWFIKLQYIGAYLIGFPSAALPQPIGQIGGGTKAAFTFYQQIGCYLAYVAIIFIPGASICVTSPCADWDGGAPTPRKRPRR